MSRRGRTARTGIPPLPCVQGRGDYATPAPQHFLYFFPLPQGHGSLRPTLAVSRTMVLTFIAPSPWAMATFMGVFFFDAGTVISTDGVDGVHFTAENNRDLGEALAPVVRDLLAR